jgi:hypothetical protein
MSLLIDTSFLWNETVWNPSMVSTALWLDAADASTITTVSGAVSQWNDKSGNGRHATQGTSGYRPAYTSAAINSKNVVTFDGTDDLLGFSALSFTNNISALSFVFVAKTSDQATGSYKAMFQLDTNTGADRATVYIRNSTIETGGRRLDADSYQFQSVGTVTTASFISTSVFNYSSANLGVNLNGDSVTSGTFQTAGNTSATNSSSISIGSSSSDSFTPDAGQSFNGQIAEFIAVPSALDTFTRQKLEGYLAHKWGLGANLPNDHPYKTVGPKP